MNREPRLPVKAYRPCPICQHHDWCLVDAHGRDAICMRVQSPTPVDCKGAGRGWLHVLDETVAPTCTDRPFLPKQYMRVRVIRLILDGWANTAPRDALRDYAEAIGVPVGALADMGAVWAEDRHALAFPMVNAWRYLCGIRLRALNGKKWAVKGSRNGLFWPAAMPQSGPLLFPEGPTDTASCLALGIAAIGRPSALVGGSMLARAHQFGELEGYSPLVVVQDQDTPRWRCTVCRTAYKQVDEPDVCECGQQDFTREHPGEAGALACAESLAKSGALVRIMAPPAGKDMRAWYQLGATRVAVMSIIKHAPLIGI